MSVFLKSLKLTPEGNMAMSSLQMMVVGMGSAVTPGWRNGPVQALPTSRWLKSDPREGANLWIEEWTAVQRHWTEILLGSKTMCPGAQTCVLGIENLPSVKGASNPRQTESSTR